MSVLSRLRPSRAHGDDGVAILMALAYIVIFTALLLAMLAIVVGQVKPTAQARKDVGSVNAAASGLQVALTTLRTATDTKADGTAGYGNRGRLPCTEGATTRFKDASTTVSTPGSKTVGTASDLPGRFQYEYNVAYYRLDPTDKPLAWLKARALDCPLPETPLYAYIQSYGVGQDELVSGTANRGNRSQTGVYQFSVPQVKVAGGPIRVRTNTSLCYDAGTLPNVGSRLSLQPCVKPTPAQQLFVYRTDLTLFYGGNSALNLCIQASASEVPNLQPCTGVGTGNTYPYSAGQQVQSWSYNDGGQFAAGKNDGNVNNKCISPANVAAGAQIVFGNCGAQLDPDPSVGAGKAGGNISGVVGPPTNQYVNFEEFGRCLDVTNFNFDRDYLIAYPCKQAPDSTKLSWNQLWQFVPTSGKVGKFFTVPDDTGNSPTPSSYKNKQVCLTADATSKFVRGTLCQTPLPLNQQWTATGSVPGSPQTSYNLVSKSRSMCMSLSSPAENYTPGIRKITIETCNGALEQRWNAPPPPPNSGLDSIREGTSVSALN